MRHNVKILDVETGQKIMTLNRIKMKKISKDNDIEKNLEKETLKKIMTLKRI